MQSFLTSGHGAQQTETKPLKILSIQLRSLGDAVVSIPALTAIRERFPDCELHALVTSTAAPLLRHHPALNQVWELDRTRGKLALKQTWSLVRALRAEHFDRSVDIGGDDRSAIFSFLCGVRERLGVANEGGFWGRRFCYTQAVSASTRDRHETARLLDILKPWGIDVPEKIDLQLFPDPRLTCPFGRQTGKRLVICHAGAACSKKMWPLAHWVRLHQLAIERGYELIFTRGVTPPEEQFIERLRALAPDVRILPLLDLPRLLITLKSADAVISNDTGPMHFAAGLGVKTVAIFGPSSSTRWSPIGPAVRILKARDCACQRHTHECRRSRHCMVEITPETVLKNLESLFGHEVSTSTFRPAVAHALEYS